MAPSIRCQSLSLEFFGGVRAVDQVDTTLLAGEITCLIGPSGCGKTTLLRLIAGLEHPTAGSVSQHPVSTAHQGQFGFVFQQPSLLPWRTAIENVMLPLELIGGQSADQRQQLAAEALQAVRMSHAALRLPHQLSGGMKMRVSIARALVTQPRVLLLDEPFAALDDLLRFELGQLLLSLWQQRRFTTVMVTHNIAEAAFLAHQIMVMHEGRIDQVIVNPLPSPRELSLRRTAQFGSFYGVVSDALRSGVSTDE